MRRSGGRRAPLGWAAPLAAGLACWLVSLGRIAGRPINFIPGRGARRAGVAAHARHYLTGCASPGTTKARPGQVQARPKIRAFERAVGLQVF
jgi:hypothetical protein